MLMTTELRRLFLYWKFSTVFVLEIWSKIHEKTPVTKFILFLHRHSVDFSIAKVYIIRHDLSEIRETSI